ncbi:hypothetical protein CEK29_17665 [Bordetella genomosp. 5]|uniref:COG3904 family protein n=1 Tax=Bordetella genomosp. 5 TaxID=1395608 RepID=UPI000B9E319E|nr:hypothetical protein [Bordetella genomosp. 5]OZI39970.1 hypothetical protein CEK29_17665 [Bordetella genomosp. 5]
MLKQSLVSLGLAWSLALGAAAQAQQAPAAPAAPSNVERFGPFFYLPSQPTMLLYTGGVGANDLLNLKKALREHPTINTLILKDNPGGLVHIGLVVAEEVYDRGLNTYIPPDSFCASACAFVYFAGRVRIADGRLGVHQISAPELTGEAAQFGVSDIVSTLPKYGVSADVLGIMFSTPAKSMYFFTPQEIEKYGINRTGATRTAQASSPQQGQPQQQQQPAAQPRTGVTQSEAPAKLPPRGAAPAAGTTANPYMDKPAGTPPNTPPNTPAQPAKPTDEQRAINAAALMIQAGSATNEEAMNFTREFYANEVDYFKKQRPKSEILDDKQRYFARWPVRRFTVDQNSLTAKCQSGLCQVRGIYDFKVSSPERGRTATGTSNFTYVLDLRNGYRIVMEDSEVISR